MAERANGVLFQNTRKTGQQPDYTGNIEITREILSEWGVALAAGTPLKVNLAGWKKVTKGGGQYLSLSASLPIKRGEGAPTNSRKSDDAPF